jgi:hypothetical protein
MTHRLVVVSCADPWARSHGGTQRTRHLVRAAMASGCPVTCIHPDEGGTAGGPPRVRWIAYPVDAVGSGRLPGWAHRAKRALLPLPTAAGARSGRLSALLRTHGIGDGVVVAASRLPEATMAAELGAVIWFDHADLWSRMVAREVGARRGPARWTAAAQGELVARREQRIVGAARVNTAAGFDDTATLHRHLRAPAARWLPNPVPARAGATPSPTLTTGGFLANFDFWPNRDAYEALVARWLAPLRRAGKRLVVAGYGSDRLPRHDGVDVLGPVRHVGQFYEAADFTVAPIRLGGGMKVKVIESLRWSRPVLATPFALAGFAPEVRSLAAAVTLDGLDADAVDDRLHASRRALAERGDALAVFDERRFDAGVAAVLATPTQRSGWHSG